MWKDDVRERPPVAGRGGASGTPKGGLKETPALSLRSQLAAIRKLGFSGWGGNRLGAPRARVGTHRGESAKDAEEMTSCWREAAGGAGGPGTVGQTHPARCSPAAEIQRRCPEVGARQDQTDGEPFFGISMLYFRTR